MNILRLLGELKSLKEIPFYQLEYWLSLHWKSSRDRLKGSGQTILVYPGFLSNNTYTYLLRFFLRNLGYQIHGWPYGFNLGYTPKKFKRCKEDMFKKSEQAEGKIIGIGYSLGGILIRELAREEPERFKLVITLGTPFANIKGTNIEWLYRLICRYNFNKISPEILARLPQPLPVPSISLYSRDDCVVNEKACYQSGESKCGYQNIEVGGTHLGLPFNLKAYQVITAALSKPQPHTLESYYRPQTATGG